MNTNSQSNQNRIAIFYVVYMKNPKVGISVSIRDYPLEKSIPLNVMS